MYTELYSTYPRWEKKNHPSMKDLTNQTFGSLLVLYRYYLNDGKNAMWVCKCTCGQIRVVRGSFLLSHKIDKCHECTKSTRNYGEKDESGKVYGKLLVLERATRGSSSGQILWKCRCECGALIDVYGWNLRSGASTSCGCQKSRGETLIAKILNIKNIEYKPQYSFIDCLGKNNNKYRFDFALFNNKNLIGLIEYDGIQHFSYKNDGSWNTKDNYEDIQIRDENKNNYCKEQNIPLLRIPYTHFSEEVVTQDIEEFLNNIGRANAQ